jgi:tetratricopeptide (TPR) repeat protein
MVRAGAFLKDKEASLMQYERLKLAFMQGNALFRRGLCAESIKAYEEALKIGGSDSILSQVHLNLGVAYTQLGMFQPAIRNFQAVLNLTGTGDWSQCANLGITYHAIGECYRMVGMFDSAAEYFQQAESIKTRHRRPAQDILKSLISTGNCYHSLGSPDRAFECFKRALKLIPP